MTETRRKHLHLGKCIEDLDQMHNVPDLKQKRLTVLCKSALKLFENAEEYREKGDEEYAYVFYMRYLRIVAYLSKEKEYQKDKNYFNGMLGIKNPKKAIDAAEILKNSLIKRYAMIQNKVRMEESAEPKTECVKITTIVAEPTQNSLLPGLDEVTIKCEQLYPILKARKLRVMILDCRPGKDFGESHINYPMCISVPEECITPGQSANVLEQNLPAESRRLWPERANVELIVMLDWSSEKVIPASTLSLLKTILLKWDVKVQYSRSPLALQGGYEDWLLKYPALTTNPQVIPPRQVDMMDDLLGDIDYPLWSDMVSPTPAPAVASARPLKLAEPIVDRSSKAAAIQVYEERARNMQHIVEQQERIADTSLTLEMQRIEAEQDWERVRGQQDNEVHDDMRAMYQLREQEIISQLMQLENKQFDMELENQLLREKLEEYQKKERESSEWLAVAARQGVDQAQQILEESKMAAREMNVKRARIAAVTEQRDKLDQKREVLEAERKRKLSEARNKRKPDLDKDEDGDTYMASPVEAPGSTGLNRSISSPNLANGTPPSDDEEPKAPTFDRSTKPAKNDPVYDIYKMNFDPCMDKVSRGLTGLKNLGNTCYMNSIIQCLSNTAVLNRFFEHGQFRKHINRSHGTGGAVAEQFAAVVGALWSGQCKHISAKNLRNELGRHHRSFHTSEQQDSHEFLTILMDWLHQDLTVEADVPPRENWTASDKAWYSFTKGKYSMITDLFYGQIKSTVRCTVCNSTSITYDSFSNLSLELPANANYCTLSDCLNLYLGGELIPGWNCPNCKEKRDAIKKLDIARRPKVLVIHFKRFYADKEGFKKKQTLIDFPLTDLDLKPFSLVERNTNSVYELYAVSNHYGSLMTGHYTALCKNYSLGKWYQYDDHIVAPISHEDVKSSAAYILFYTLYRSTNTS